MNTAEVFNVAEKQFTSPDAALKFILAGNAYFTLRSKKTGVRYTFCVSAVESKNPDQQTLWNDLTVTVPQKWFVSLLVGPENTSDYAYIGLIETDRGFSAELGRLLVNFRLTRKSRMTAESVPVKALQYALTHLRMGDIPEQLEVWHEGRCGRCGRVLTVPESIALGIGPDCAGRMQKKVEPLEVAA
jgi:hypothetical protein